MTNLLIVGTSCSGKTAARKMLERHYGYCGFEASEIVRKITSSGRSLAQTFEEMGYDYVARSIADQITSKPFVVSGFRTVEEVCCMLSLHRCKVVAMYSPLEVCFRRAQQRRRNDCPDTLKEFYAKIVCRDYALGLARIISDQADHIVCNVGDEKSLKTALADMLEGLDG